MLARNQVQSRTLREVIVEETWSRVRPTGRATCRVNGAQITMEVVGKQGSQVADDLHAHVVALWWPPRAHTPHGYNKPPMPKSRSRPACAPKHMHAAMPHISATGRSYTQVKLSDLRRQAAQNLGFYVFDYAELERRALAFGGMSFERLKDHAREHYGVQLEEFIHDSYIGKPIEGSVPVGTITQCQPKKGSKS